MMNCVSTVSYSILVNRQPSPSILPERGLRQGDPLSPYLFLFCAEALTALLKRAEQAGRIHGFRVAKNAPAISHLFFADDTILFTRATNQEAQEVKNLISQYEAASGQKINLAKTELSVSHNVPNEKRKELSNLLMVKDVDKHSKYLGFPTIIGRSKKEVFASIMDRITKKMKDWKEKLLTQAGRETLLKSVIQAIPTYLMNCFLLPLTLCQDFEKEIARFFWSSTKEKRKTHWANWNTLATSKQAGGLGFREIHEFKSRVLQSSSLTHLVNEFN